MNLRFDKIGLGKDRGEAVEKEILDEFENNKKEAFIRAYDLYVDRIYRFVFFKVKSESEAQDLTSQIFLKTWNYLLDNNLQDPRTLKALLYKISRTTIIDHYRKNSQNIISIDEEDSKINLVDEKSDLKKKAEVDSEIENLLEKLAQLKDEYREVIIMKYLEELSIGEIADILGKTKGSVRVLLHRAVKAAKEIVGE